MATQIDLNYLLARKPDFYELSQAQQIKYIAFILIQNNNLSTFTPGAVRQLFDQFNLTIPSNLSREIGKMLKGKPPIFVRKSKGYAIHPNEEKKLILELFSTTKTGTSEEQGKSDNTEIFSRYDFHPTIKKVAFKQFQDGYYKEAIQNALVEVIDQVKIKTKHPKGSNGKDLDGDDLMNHVFGCDNQKPKIKFNSLKTSLDKAEQRGIMNLYKGIVGIRDKKAHLNFIQNDPLKTIEYLSLASLLLRMLNEYKTYS